MKKVKIPIIIFIIFFIIFEELVFSKLIFESFAGILWKILFSVPVSIIIYLIVSLFNEKANKVITFIIVFLISFIFSAQLIYFKIYQSIISFYSFANGGQVLEFIDMIIKTMISNSVGLLLIFTPLILLIVLTILKIINFKQSTKNEKIMYIVCLVVIQALSVGLITFMKSEEIYSNKNLYYNVHAPLITTNKLGLLTTMRLDFQRLLFGFEEKSLKLPNTEELTNIDKDNLTQYQLLEIDFDKLIEQETDNTIIQMHEYFKDELPSKKNKYTGMFKDKNLIVFVAEAFSQMSIREDVTPTLYKLYTQGFQFDNFYTPIFPVSTADGEYIADTSLIPKEGVWSIKRINGNYMPYSFANVFKNLGYSTNAYHNHTYSYYNRDLYIKTMGYDSYLAKGNGLEKRMNCENWPNSDYEMIKVTTDDYIKNDRFLAYYMTVSGHLNYTTSGNVMASRNWEVVKDLPYSHKAKSYLATQVELDKALAELLERLEDEGKLEDTVIAISGDHYPYGLTLEEINELSNFKRDDTFEKYRMPFILWSGSMEPPIKIDKLSSSLDILPTILNLFGVEYDSRLLIGRDILSDSEPLVIFSNRSFITDKGGYNAITGEFIKNEDIHDNYISNISSIIYEKYKMSKLVLENNYYNLLKDQL